MTDVDDERMGALFRAAAGDPDAPEPGFDHTAVVRASRRATTRRRALLLGAGAAALVVVIGGALTVPGWFAGGAPSPATLAAPVPAEAPAAPNLRRDVGPPLAEGAPGAAAVPDPTGAGVPLGPGTTGCADRQDPALRALVEQALPEVVGVPAAATTTECRPGGERGVNLEVRDGAATGLLTVQYLPPGTAPRPVQGAQVAPTGSGGTLVVSIRAERPGEPVPFAARLTDLVTQLAPRV